MLPVAWLVGSTAGVWIAPQLTLPGLEIILTIGLGALLAADCPLSFAFVVTLAILLGLFHGILKGAELAQKPSSGEVIAVGVTVGLFVLDVPEGGTLRQRLIKRRRYRYGCEIERA